MTNDAVQEQGEVGDTEGEKVQVDEKPTEAETKEKSGDDQEAEPAEVKEKIDVDEAYSGFVKAVMAGELCPSSAFRLPPELVAILLTKGYSVDKVIDISKALHDIEEAIPDDGGISFAMVSKKEMDKFIEFQKSGDSEPCPPQATDGNNGPKDDYIKFNDCRPAEMVRRLREAILEQAKAMEALAQKIDLYELHKHEDKGEGEPIVRMFTASRRFDSTMPHAARWRLE